MIVECLLVMMVSFTTNDLENWRIGMELQHNILNHFNRRKIKCLTVNVMGIAGLTIAMVAIVFSHDQAAMLTQVGQDLSQSPMGVILTSIKSLF